MFQRLDVRLLLYNGGAKVLSQQDVHRVYRVCAVCRDKENEGNRLTRCSMAEALIGTTPPVSFAVSPDPSSTWNARAFALASSAIAALLGRHLFSRLSAA